MEEVYKSNQTAEGDKFKNIIEQHYDIFKKVIIFVQATIYFKSIELVNLQQERKTETINNIIEYIIDEFLLSLQNDKKYQNIFREMGLSNFKKIFQQAILASREIINSSFLEVLHAVIKIIALNQAISHQHALKEFMEHFINPETREAFKSFGKSFGEWMSLKPIDIVKFDSEIIRQHEVENENSYQLNSNELQVWAKNEDEKHLSELKRKVNISAYGYSADPKDYHDEKMAGNKALLVNAVLISIVFFGSQEGTLYILKTFDDFFSSLTDWFRGQLLPHKLIYPPEKVCDEVSSKQTTYICFILLILYIGLYYIYRESIKSSKNQRQKSNKFHEIENASKIEKAKQLIDSIQIIFNTNIKDNLLPDVRDTTPSPIEQKGHYVLSAMM